VTALERCDSCGKPIDGVCADCHFANGSWMPRGKELSGLPVQVDHTDKREEEQPRTRTRTRTRDVGSLPFDDEPSPSSGGTKPETRELYDDYLAHRLEPERVELGEMPSDATRPMVVIAEHMRVLMGLRLKAGEDRPLPYACSMAADIGIDDKAVAWRALRRLVKAGVVDYVGNMPPRGFREGTRLYAPPAAAEVVDLRDRQEAA
jgi:hypothetical protein